MFISHDTIKFMEDNNAPVSVRQNLSDIQANADAAHKVKENDSLITFNERAGS